MIMFALGILFMLYSILTATTPLLAEEDYAGTTFSDLKATNPRIANIVWHDHVGFGTVNFGLSLLVVILAWKGLSRGSSLAWHSLLIIGLTSLAWLLLAHLPMGNFHFLTGLVPNAIYFIALAISRSHGEQIMEGHVKDRRLTIGWILIFVLGIFSMAYSVIVATTPLLGEEEYVGTSFASLQATNPQIAKVIWHDTIAFGTIVFGGSLLVVVLAWKGLSKGSRLAWYSFLILGLTPLVALPLAHFPIGNTSFVHIGPGFILLTISLIALAVSAKLVFSKSVRAA